MKTSLWALADIQRSADQSREQAGAEEIASTKISLQFQKDPSYRYYEIQGTGGVESREDNRRLREEPNISKIYRAMMKVRFRDVWTKTGAQKYTVARSTEEKISTLSKQSLIKRLLTVTHKVLSHSRCEKASVCLGVKLKDLYCRSGLKKEECKL